MADIVQVAAALIWDEKGRFLICQRPAEKARGGLWEFAGGKLEPGETPRQALIRECREELAVDLEVGSLYMELLHEYPDMTVRLYLFNARISAGEPRLLEHQKLVWVSPKETTAYDFCPADTQILAKLRQEAGLQY